MRLAANMLALVALGLISACGLGGPSGPTHEELVQSLQAASPGEPILSASLGECQAGEINEQPVKVCGVCVVSVGIGRGENTWEEGAFLRVARRTGSVAFRRAFSREQPDVEPGPGQRGVWIGVPSTIDMAAAGRLAALSNDQMRRAGYVRRTHLSALVGSATSSVSPEVAEKLTGDLSQELVALVGSCDSDPAHPVAETSAQQSLSASDQVTVDRPQSSVLALLATRPDGYPRLQGATHTIRDFELPGTIVADIALPDGAVLGARYLVEPAGDGSRISVRVASELSTADLGQMQQIAGVMTAYLTTEVGQLPDVDFSGLRYSTVSRQAQTYIYQPVTSPADPARLRESEISGLRTVSDFIRASGLRGVGAPILVRTAVANDGQELSFRIGRAVEGPLPLTIVGVQAGEVPSGTAIRVEYRGDAAGIQRTYQQLFALLQATRIDVATTPALEFIHEDLGSTGAPIHREILLFVTGDTAMLDRLRTPAQ